MDFSARFPMQLGQKEKAVLIRCNDLNRNLYLFIQLIFAEYLLRTRLRGSEVAGRKEEN